MKNDLNTVLESIDRTFGNDVAQGARNYLEIDIGNQARILGFENLGPHYDHVFAIVPLKNPRAGMKVRIDGRTFVGYMAYGAGIAVPGYVAKDADLPMKDYTANDSMILNMA